MNTWQPKLRRVTEIAMCPPNFISTLSVDKRDHVSQILWKLHGVMRWSFGHEMQEKVMHVAFRILL